MFSKKITKVVAIALVVLMGLSAMCVTPDVVKANEESLAARRSNMIQLAELIQERSTGRAVIVIGDTNSRYTRAEDNFEEAVLETCGLTDPWVEFKYGGVAPADGEALFDWERFIFWLNRKRDMYMQRAIRGSLFSLY